MRLVNFPEQLFRRAFANGCLKKVLQWIKLVISYVNLIGKILSIFLIFPIFLTVTYRKSETLEVF